MAIAPEASAGSRSRSGCGARSPVRPSSKAISMFAASPLADRSIGVASSCPSTNTRPARPATSRSAGTAASSTAQSAPYTNGNRPAASEERTRRCSASTICSRARSLSSPEPAARCATGPGSTRSGSMTTSGPNTACNPAARNAAGAPAWPRARPMPSNGTPIMSIRAPPAVFPAVAGFPIRVLPAIAGRSELPGGVADGLVEDRQAERKFVLGGGQWRGDPENAAHAGQLNDVHVQAQFEATSGDERAQLVGAAFGLAVDDQFEAD